MADVGEVLDELLRVRDTAAVAAAAAASLLQPLKSLYLLLLLLLLLLLASPASFRMSRCAAELHLQRSVVVCFVWF